MIVLKATHSAKGEVVFSLYKEDSIILEGFAPGITDYPEFEFNDGTHEVVIESNDTRVVLFVHRIEWCEMKVDDLGNEVPFGFTPEEFLELCEEDPDKADRMMFGGDSDE